MTIGEDRVRVKFNPSANGTVDQIKQKTAELIDIVDELDVSPNGERVRCMRLVQTAYEEAAMWAVSSNSMTNLEIFLKARQLIEDPQNWWQGFLDPGKAIATSHCLQTAVGHAGGYAHNYEAMKVIWAIIGTEDVPAWNDHCDRTHAEVIAVLDQAILIESQKVFKGKI